MSGEHPGSGTLSPQFRQDRLRCRLSTDQRAVDPLAREGIGETAGVSHQKNAIPQIRLNIFGRTLTGADPQILPRHTMQDFFAAQPVLYVAQKPAAHSRRSWPLAPSAPTRKRPR